MTGSDQSATALDEKGRNGGGLWHRGVRRGDWLTWDRIGFACLCTAVGMLLGLGWMLLVPNSFTSPNGTLLMDYLSFWLAGREALSGTPELVYRTADFAHLQQDLTASDTFFGFFYPPTFQLLQAMFAWLPYKAAFAAFVAVTTGLLFVTCRLIAGRWLLAACLILIPACANNAFFGQNAALTAALFGLFLVGVERERMVLGGIALGLLTMKPQLGVLIPIALIAAMNWRAFLSASLTAVVLAALSAAILGVGVWQAFWQQAPVAAAVMETGGVEWQKMISVYASARLFGLGHGSAMGVQILVGLGALACVWTAWRRTQRMEVLAPVLAGGTLLATPFALSYDLTLLVVPCAYLIRSGLERGFPPYEKMVLCLVIGLSASTSPIAIWLGLPLAPLLPLMVLILGMRHLANDGSATEGGKAALDALQGDAQSGAAVL